VDGDDGSGERSPDAGDVLMLAVPNFTSSNSNRPSSALSSIHGSATDIHEAALLLSKLMTPLRQSNITPLSFVSLQLEKVVYLFFTFHIFADSANQIFARIAKKCANL